MIRPVNFNYNYETAINNAFQSLLDENDVNVQEKALAQFDSLVDLLRSNGVDVTVVEDTPLPHTPDSIFPNNWVTFFEDNNGTICVHSMFAVNRRAEKKPHVLRAVAERFTITDTIDFTRFESAEEFLEGTGSMVLDRKNRIAYACLSMRTNYRAFQEFCRVMCYHGVPFQAQDAHGRDVYHTNVMMSVGDHFAVVCLDTIRRESEKLRVIESLTGTGKEIIAIDIGQMMRFAGNCLQLQNGLNGEKILVLSKQAYKSLRGEQIERLSRHSKIVTADVDIIELHGGGSVRCMIAEIFLPTK